jgi:hypothetical protein
MSSNGGFLLRAQIPYAYTADNYNPGYEIGHAFDPYSSIVFESSQNAVTIRFSYTIARKIEGISLINHNIPETATMKFRYCLNDQYDMDVEKNISWAERNIYLFDTLVSTYSYYEIYISAGQPIQIGYIFPAKTALQFPHMFSYSYKKKFNVGKSVETTDEGVHIETPAENAPEWYEFSITFDDVVQSFYSIYCDLIRPGNKVFFLSAESPECYYGIVPTKALDAQVEFSGDTYTIDFFEHATGEKQ